MQDYRRIMLEVEGSPWLSERAVGPVAHVLAELMENAATFSRPPTPVEVRAAIVGRGLAIEIEDRGLGMDPEQFAAANELMSRPPRMDVLAKADDIRLGFYVVARLAANAGLRVEFRPSAFGGTRAVVLIPAELVADGDPGYDAVEPVEPIPLPTRSRGRALPGAPPALPVPESLAPVVALPDFAGTPYPGAEHLTPGFAEPAYAEAEFAEAEYADASYADMEPVGAQYVGAGMASPYPASQHQAPQQHRPSPYPAEDHTGYQGGYQGEGHRSAEQPYAATTSTGYQLAGESARPADRPSWAARPEPYGHGGRAGGGAADAPADGLTDDGKPLPKRVRQANLAAELRLPPPQQAQPAPDQESGGSPFQRPAPRRSGAAIGAFQRQSRAARGQEPDQGHQQHPAPPAQDPSPWDEPRANPLSPRTEDRI